MCFITQKTHNPQKVKVQLAPLLISAAIKDLIPPIQGTKRILMGLRTKQKKPNLRQ